VDARYHRFARAHAVFYDDPARVPPINRGRFAPAADVDWTGWTSHDDGHWNGWFPTDRTLPEQGWKIHVSATPSVADEVLRQVSRYCHAQSLAFKHVTDRAVLFATNAKDADRASGGKFITVYPPDDATLRRTLDDLDDAVGGLPGPYVLSDLRWRQGPLSVRYGAFVHRSIVGEDGAEVLALRHPDGHLVEDVREPGFVPPAWVTLPAFLQEQREALGTLEPPAGFPRILGVMHYSNAGGVYDAEDAETGERIVLKEARPHTGITPDGRDAVARLQDEEATLRALEGRPVVSVRGAFSLHGHRFLLLERAEGVAVQAAVTPRSPLIRAHRTPADYIEYGRWAVEVTDAVADAVAAVHDAGLSHGDVHPGNAMLDDDGRITLLDLEMAGGIDDAAAVAFGVPGFSIRDGRDRRAGDLYGVACIRLFVFFPLTSLFALDPLKAEDLLAAAAATFALDDEWIERVRRDLALPAPPATTDPVRAARIDDAVRRWDVHDEAAIRLLQAEVLAELDASAEPGRTDRLWPGDPRQFQEDGTGLAYGAGGVVYARAVTGAVPDERALAWMDAAMRRPEDPRRPHRAGLWDGLAGVAWLQRRLGRHERADEAVTRLRGTDLSSLGTDLYGGLPGVGLVLLDESEADPTLLVEALEISDVLRERHDARPPLAVEPHDRRVATGAGGLLRGATGTALFALRLYEATGDREHLRLAEDALAYDLAHCFTADDGSLQLNEGWRLMPYLGSGSAGIGVVAAQLIAHSHTPDRWAEALDGIRTAALTDFAIESGVFQGRSGLILFLAALRQLGQSTPRADEALAHHVAELRLHALRRPDGIAFPGQGLLRVSCDLATGSAGVLLALETYARVLADDPAPSLFPLLMPSAAASSLRPPAARRIPGRR
jgi:hypothetical protein